MESIRARRISNSLSETSAFALARASHEEGKVSEITALLAA